MAAPDRRQVWIGSVPPEVGEDELMALLHRHYIRPYKIVLRSRPGQEPGLPDVFVCLDVIHLADIHLDAACNASHHDIHLDAAGNAL